MNILIAKLGATGDVVRTSSLLRQLSGHISWITAAKNVVLLQNIGYNIRCCTWEERDLFRDRAYDLVINLEDTTEVASFVTKLETRKIFGAYLGSDNSLQYTDDSHRWFDLSLISRYGRAEADKLKFKNRDSYQELIFGGLGLKFTDQQYVLPTPVKTDLKGDVAIAAEVGSVWPMKNWAHYGELGDRLKAEGLKVNFLPQRKSLLEHLGDVSNHRCLVGGDSLPMHLALGRRVSCVSIFNCTSPWEIFDYGIQTKLVSPLLGQFFYQRGLNAAATTAITLDEVFAAVVARL